MTTNGWLAISILADFMFVLSSVRAGHIMNGYESVLLGKLLVVRGEGRAPAITTNAAAVTSTNSKTCVSILLAIH